MSHSSKSITIDLQRFYHKCALDLNRALNRIINMGKWVGIDKICTVVQWSTLGIPLEKIIKWRNENTNFAKKIITSISCASIGVATSVIMISKIAIGIVTLIPPFTELGLTLLASTLLFESTVLILSIKSSISSLLFEKVKDFEVE